MRLACAFPHPGNGSLAVNPGWELQGIDVRILSYVTPVSLVMSTHLLSLPPSDYPQPAGSYESVLLSHLSQPNQRVTRPRSNNPCANWKQPSEKNEILSVRVPLDVDKRPRCLLLSASLAGRSSFPCPPASQTSTSSRLPCASTLRTGIRECQSFYSVF